MTLFWQCAVHPRSRRGMRSSSVAAVTAVAVLIPAGGALANHMPGMTNGTMCPHASGEGPNALAAPGPDEPATPERAPSEAPLAPAAQDVPAAAAPAPAAKPPAQGTKPGQQASKPATQVPAEIPTRVTTSAQAVSAVQAAQLVASTPVPASTTTTVQLRAKQAARLRAKQAARRERAAEARRERAAERRAQETLLRRLHGMEPQGAWVANAVSDPVAVSRSAPSEPAVAVSPLWLLALLAVGGLGALIVMLSRRRGTGGVVAIAPPERLPGPERADAAIEAELHEMIAESRARALLGPVEGEDKEDRFEHAGFPER